MVMRCIVRYADELDSFMFQTVGHEGIVLYAEAMELPLYRVNTRGRAFAQELQYSPVEGDEVEDLYELLRRVRGEVEVEGVACGAVLSDYQRLRVENVLVFDVDSWPCVGSAELSSSSLPLLLAHPAAVALDWCA